MSASDYCVFIDGESRCCGAVPTMPVNPDVAHRQNTFLDHLERLKSVFGALTTIYIESLNNIPVHSSRP